MTTIVSYVSGHGFGHASRHIEVLRAIRRREPAARIVLRSTVPSWFVRTSLEPPFELHAVETDVGVVQIDSVRLDEDTTARAAALFYDDFERRSDEEAAALKALDTSLVLGDIPPLGFSAAGRAGLPAVAISNFTWDWIYGGYSSFERLAPGVVEIIRDAYRHTSLALRLPFHGGFGPMAGVTRDIPLIARQATLARGTARERLGLTDAEPVVLASFGGFGLGLPYADIARHNQFTLIVTDHETDAPDRAVGNLRCLSIAELGREGIRYADLVSAADVVVTKLGYGIVSECIANDAALLYVRRGRFLEQDVFEAELPSVLRTSRISLEDLEAGRWWPAVEALLGKAEPPNPITRTDGADEAARLVLETLRWRSS